MKKLFFGLIATVIISVSGFAKNDLNESIVDKNEVSVKIENCKDKINVSFNLGDITNLSKSEVNVLCENAISQIVDLKDFTSCTVTISGTISIYGQSITISFAATAPTCEQAGAMARRGLSNELSKIKKIVEDAFD